MGGDQQAEDQEHADLRQPGEAVEDVQDAVPRADRLVAQQQAAQVDGQDAAATDGVGAGENHQAAADHQQRVQAVSQLQAVDDLQQQPAAAEAEHRADGEIADQVQAQLPADALAGAGENLDQGHGKKHRHRVVAAGLDLQGGGDPLIEAAATEQAEHRGGVGGANDGADQHAFQQAQVEQPGRGKAGQPGGHQHAEGGQRQRGPQRHAEALDPRAHATIQQDDRQRQVADQIRRGVVAELDAAGAVVAGQHADCEKHHQNRNAEARTEGADQNADGHQQRADQEQAVDGAGVHRRTPE